MINVNELRIGNVLYAKTQGLNGIVSKIDNCSFNTREIHLTIKEADNDNWGFWVEELEPIPLTEELLLRCGFEAVKFSYIKRVKATHHKVETIELFVNTDKTMPYWYLHFRQGDDENRDNWHKSDFVLLRRDIQYLHQLQNLYFDLTNKELTLKP